MKNWTILAGALAMTLLASGRAEAANCADVSFSPTSVNFGQTWDPMISPTAIALSFTASFSNFKSGSKDIRVIFLDNDAGLPLRLGTSGPKYTVSFGSTNYGFPLGTLVTTQPDTMAIPSGQNPRIDRNFTVTIPANTSPAEDFLGGQVFSETLKYTLECLKSPGTTNNGTDAVQIAPTISLTIPKLVSLTMAREQTINFGSFTTASQLLNVGLKSTSTVNVSVATTNSNKLVLDGAVAPYPANSTINYSMTLNSDTIANGTTLTNRAKAGVEGTSWPLILTLTDGLPSGKLAGSYRDTITLTLTPGT